MAAAIEAGTGATVGEQLQQDGVRHAAAPLDRTAYRHRAAAAEHIDKTFIVIRHQLVDDPQQLALTAYPGDKTVQDAPSFKGKASSDRSNPRLAAASPFSMF